MNSHQIFLWLLEELKKHEEILVPLALAAIVSMSPQLPYPFSRVEALEWSYEWLRRTLMTFASMRGPVQHEAVVERKTETESDGGKVVTEKEHVSSAEPLDKEKK